MDYKNIAHPFAPVADQHAKILILGTFPSVKSRENEFYYGHPQNRFWRVLAAVLECDLPHTIVEKKNVLLSHHIAIWDVISHCDIVGSRDGSIKNVVPSDIHSLLKNTAITKIFANGNTAKKLYDTYIMETTGVGITVLPSTSPANAAYHLEQLITAWKIIQQ